MRLQETLYKQGLILIQASISNCIRYLLKCQRECIAIKKWISNFIKHFEMVQLRISAEIKAEPCQ